MPLTQDFHDERFPLRVAFGATGGPERRTEIVQLLSGAERRNARQAHARRRFDAASGVRSLADLEAVTAFFEARRGELFAFRFRDPFDHKSCETGGTPSAADQPLGAGDGTRTQFQLVKLYGSGPDPYVRPIALPVPSSVRVAVAGSELAPSAFVTDPLTGMVTLATAPAAGAAVTAGYAFDIKARFDTPSLTLSVARFNAGEIPSIPLVEVLA